jgi:hypothetical protein
MQTPDAGNSPAQSEAEDTSEATSEQDSKDENDRWRDAWPAPLRGIADRYCPVRPDAPDDAEPSSRKRWRDRWPAPFRCVADYVHPVPWDPPERFPQSLDTLRARLSTDDDKLADELLADAERLFAETEDRVESAERRATTLQGTVAIAATVALTGAGLVLDPAKLRGDDWRTAFAFGLAALVLLLVLTAVRATGASTRVFNFTTPSDDDIFERAQLSAAEAKTRRAAYLLHGYGRNNEVAALKIGYLRSAAFWFRGALLILLLLTAMLSLYVLDSRGNEAVGRSSTSETQQRKGTTTPSPTPRQPSATTPAPAAPRPTPSRPAPTSTGTPTQTATP